MLQASVLLQGSITDQSRMEPKSLAGVREQLRGHGASLGLLFAALITSWGNSEQNPYVSTKELSPS